ncbi:MAG: AraC family transcriptional regulator [Clostridia bacterium]|nr:AraC family transcriptional regulator [Clostridia bacterium]
MKFFEAMDEWHYDPCQYMMNFHEHFEIVYMISGKCKAIVDNVEYILEVGDFLVVFPFQIHEYIPLEDKNNKFLVMSLTAKRISDWYPTMKITTKNGKVAAENVSDFLKLLVKKIESTPRARSGSDHAITTTISQAILLELLTMIEIFERSEILVTNHEKILLCCEAEFRDYTFTLEALSKKTGISKRSISRFFSNDIKISFSRFISLMRLEYARKLIKRKDYTFTTAALESGFGTVRSFNMAFKREFGVAPRDYFKGK